LSEAIPITFGDASLMGFASAQPIRLSSPGLTGRPSIPESQRRSCSTQKPGVLDRPVKPGDDKGECEPRSAAPDDFLLSHARLIVIGIFPNPV